MAKETTAEEAKAQILILEDIIDIRGLQGSNSLGVKFALRLIAALSIQETTPHKYILYMADANYDAFINNLNNDELDRFIQTGRSTWDDVLFHALVCQRLVEENI